MDLEKNFEIFKKWFEELEKQKKGKLKIEYKLSEKNISELLKIYSLKEEVLYRNYNKEVYKEKLVTEYEQGLYNGAKMQADHIVFIMLERYLKNHIKEKGIECINFLDFKTELKELKNILNVNHDILTLEYDINYLAKAENVYAEHEEDYYLLISKDNNEKEYNITYITFGKVIEDYKLDETDKKMLLEKYNFSV